MKRDNKKRGGIREKGGIKDIRGSVPPTCSSVVMFGPGLVSVTIISLNGATSFNLLANLMHSTKVFRSVVPSQY